MGGGAQTQLHIYLWISYASDEDQKRKGGKGELRKGKYWPPHEKDKKQRTKRRPILGGIFYGDLNSRKEGVQEGGSEKKGNISVCISAGVINVNWDGCSVNRGRGLT